MTVGGTSRCRVLVAGLPRDLADSPFDAFAVRHRRIVETIASRHHVVALYLRPHHDDSSTPEVLGVGEAAEVELAAVIHTSSRSTRARYALRRVRDADTRLDQQVARAARSLRPDIAVTLGPWLGPEYHALFKLYPTLHIFEEEVTRMAEVASQSWRGRLFRAVETRLHGRARAQPEMVAVISRREATAAALRYPRAELLYLPLTLSREQWPLFATPSSGDAVLVVGNLTEARNADGLAAILAELARRDDAAKIRVRLVSDSGLHTALLPFIDAPSVEYARPAGSLPSRYRNAWAALIPALRVTGQKTTILQAWTCGCPVVCSTAAADSVEAPHAVSSGRDAGDIVGHMLTMAGNAEMRTRLVDAGFAEVETHFNPQRQIDHLLGAIDRLRRGRHAARESDGEAAP